MADPIGEDLNLPGARLPKAPTGIRGVDEITRGGLPKGRPTLVCGGPGAGKTLFAVSFLVNGIEQFGEPGVLMSFEETERDIAADVASLGFDVARLVADRRLAIDHVHIERSEIEETGEYDLEALFVRLDHAVRSVGARRVVLDTVESLFGGLPNELILRAELRRLFRWLKDRDLTTVITGERGEHALTRHGLEEYVSDAVIVLDHRVHEQISTRRLRVIKYRGSHHGTNEYPFLIDADGITVLPVTAIGLTHQALTGRVSSGIPQLDGMLGGEGFFRGSTILISGGAGTGKTSFAAQFIESACRRGERAVWFLFEESPDQLLRNMRSIGVDLQPWVTAGLLRFHADRPTQYGLETHLATMHRAVAELHPTIVVVDPVTNLISVGTAADVQAMLTRFIDHLKLEQITALFTSLTSAGGSVGKGNGTVSSLVDSWILVGLATIGNERRRHVSVLKSRGMAHSHQIREFMLTDAGVAIGDAAPAARTLRGIL